MARRPADQVSCGERLARQCRPVLLDRHAGISERGVPGRHTEHNLETGCRAVGHQVRLPGGGAERGLDIERGRFRVCRQHLCDNGGDGADIAGAVGKQHGVTVLDGKRHSGEDRTVLEKLSCPNWRVVEGPAPAPCLPFAALFRRTRPFPHTLHLARVGVDSNCSRTSGGLVNQHSTRGLDGEGGCAAMSSEIEFPRSELDFVA